ncbi:Glycosyl hydrolase family 61 [Rhizoctonia solani]|uniref:lytic cellulose monooxygenase (C4-dehydrogenating) n=1 Tax=Rhizoctonia solani TaxID=456999 RepID=A0A8H7M604_9AGAM|nr:Glycosyl hydrolase family 61 [Rhizoctonia solani]
MLFTSLAVLVAGATSVRAHGYVQKVADDGPITFDSGDLTCNKGGAVGNGETATVAAGQSVTWTMNTWPADHKGPVTVYMANCGDSCDNFDGSGNKWYKLSSEGLIDAGSFYWASDKLISQGNSWTQTIPSNIMPGNYLMRLEILALHSAGSPQFYPSCTQLKVTGGGDGAPGESEAPAVVASGWSKRCCIRQRWIGSCPCPAPAPTTSDPEPSSSKPAPSSTYSEPESYPSPTKGPLPTTPVATTKTKVCRIKRSQKNHFAKREYLRGWARETLNPFVSSFLFPSIPHPPSLRMKFDIFIGLRAGLCLLFLLFCASLE